MKTRITSYELGLLHLQTKPWFILFLLRVILVGCCVMFAARSTILNAQTLEELIQLARDNNPSLTVMDGKYEAAKYKGDQVAAYPDPQIALGFGAFPVETRLGPQQMKMGISQRLLWKGELAARRDLADAQAELMAHQSENRMIDLAFVIRRAYFDLVFTESAMTLLRSKIEVLDVLEEIAKNAIEGGKGKLSNVLLIRRNVEELESRIAELEVEKNYYSIRINHAIGRKPDIQIIPDTVDQALWENEVLLDPSYLDSGHPRIKTLNNMKTVSEKAIDLTTFTSKPKVMVGLEYAMIDRRPQIDIASNGRDVLMPMGSFTIPLHTKQYEAKRQEEKVRIRTVEASIENLKNDFNSEIWMARAQMDEAEVLFQSSARLKDLTLSTIDLMRTEYIQDGSRFEELLRLEMELIQYDLDIEKARKQKRIALAALEKYMP